MPNDPSTPPSPALSLLESSSKTRLIFGAGCLSRVGELARDLRARRCLLVTDAGIVVAGYAAQAQANLESAGLQVAVFDGVRENPTTRCVEECVAVAKAARVDTIIGLGGGSAMDTAKGCNFIFTNGGRMQDYWGLGKAREAMLPFMAIPTTAGTGSEMQSAALIADEQTHQKMACLDPKCAARGVILDPLLTLSQPPRVTACTGMDALAHAVETAVTTKRTPRSWAYSREAFRLCVAAFPEVLLHPEDLEARGHVLLGAALAGAAIENSMLGAAHAAANPLTARYGIVHGQAVGLMLPHVVRFNTGEPSARAAYAELAGCAGLVGTNEGAQHAVGSLLARLEHLLGLAALKCRLSACGMQAGDIPSLAEEAARQWTAGFNPRKVTAEDFTRFYADAYAAETGLGG